MSIINIRSLRFSLTSSFLLLLNLTLLMFLKYEINGMQIEELNLFYLGNLLNIFLFATILIPLIIFPFIKNERSGFDRSIVKMILIIMLLILLGVLLIVKMKIDFGGEYLFNYPVKRVLIGLFFIAHLQISIYLSVLLWGFLFGEGAILYLKSIIISSAALILLTMFSFVYGTSYDDKFDYINEEVVYDVTVVLGAAVWSDNNPSPLFKGRIEKAKELLQQGKTRKIQLTGGNAPGEISEAESAYNYLSGFEIKDSKILIEKNTATTTEQIKYIKNNLSRNIEFQNILIVSDNFHLMRVLEIAKFYNVKANGVASSYKMHWDKLLFYRIRDSIALLLFWFFAI